MEKQTAATDRSLEAVHEQLSTRLQEKMVNEVNALRPPRESGPLVGMITSYARYQMELKEIEDRYRKKINKFNIFRIGWRKLSSFLKQ